MKNKNIEKLEEATLLLGAIGDLSRLQEDYIDFKECEDRDNALDNALLTLTELKRTKEEHLTLSYLMEEKINETRKILESVLKEMYKEKEAL